MFKSPYKGRIQKLVYQCIKEGEMKIFGLDDARLMNQLLYEMCVDRVIEILDEFYVHIKIVNHVDVYKYWYYNECSYNKFQNSKECNVNEKREDKFEKSVHQLQLW